MTITIVPITPLHTAIAAAVHAQCFNRPSEEEYFLAGMLAMPGTFGWLAMLDLNRESTENRKRDTKGNRFPPLSGGLPAGLMVCRSTVGESEILTVGVRPQVRRLGIGSLLFKNIQNTMPGETLLLEVAVDNMAARNLYQKLGFKQVGRRSHYYPRNDGVNVDALVLRF